MTISQRAAGIQSQIEKLNDELEIYRKFNSLLDQSRELIGQAQLIGLGDSLEEMRSQLQEVWGFKVGDCEYPVDRIEGASEAVELVELGVDESEEQGIPLDERVKAFIKEFNEETTTWEDLRRHANNDPDFVPKLMTIRTRKKDKVRPAVPRMLADWIAKGNSDDRRWVPGNVWFSAQRLLKTKQAGLKNTPTQTMDDALRKSAQIDEEVNDFAQQIIRMDVSNVKSKVDELINLGLAGNDAIAKLLMSKLAELPCDGMLMMTVNSYCMKYLNESVA